MGTLSTRWNDVQIGVGGIKCPDILLSEEGGGLNVRVDRARIYAGNSFEVKSDPANVKIWEFAQELCRRFNAGNGTVKEGEGNG